MCKGFPYNHPQYHHPTLKHIYVSKNLGLLFFFQVTFNKTLNEVYLCSSTTKYSYFLPYNIIKFLKSVSLGPDIDLRQGLNKRKLAKLKPIKLVHSLIKHLFSASSLPSMIVLESIYFIFP